MKYKELEAESTNTFKIGDRVRVYNLQFYEGIIIEDPARHTDMVRVRIGEGRDSASSLAHWKACRKLVEVEPKEFWLYGNRERALQVCDTPPILTYDTVIRVREVVE